MSDQRLTCQRCDAPLSGKQQKWCSENCCKRASAGAHRTSRCECCGTTLHENARWKGTTLCQSCDRQRRRDLLDQRVQFVAGLYNEGASQREIGDALGWTGIPGQLLLEARKRGLIGYRNHGYGQTT